MLLLCPKIFSSSQSQGWNWEYWWWFAGPALAEPTCQPGSPFTFSLFCGRYTRLPAAPATYHQKLIRETLNFVSSVWNISPQIVKSLLYFLGSLFSNHVDLLWHQIYISYLSSVSIALFTFITAHANNHHYAIQLFLCLFTLSPLSRMKLTAMFSWQCRCTINICWINEW